MDSLLFKDVTIEAQYQTEKQIEFILKKAKFFDSFASQLNERQLKVIRRMLKEGIKGFQGGMNAKKYMAISPTSKATATRDLQDLVEKQFFVASGGGRSTSYTLNF